MKKLARKWRESHSDADDDKFSLPTLDDSRPMDTQEQEELVRSLEKSQAQQSLLWRSVFAVLLFCYAAFLIYSIFRQSSSPWELCCFPYLSAIALFLNMYVLLPFNEQRYHAYFMDEVDSRMIIFADWVAVLACSMTIIGLLQNSEYHRRWIWYSCSAGVTLAVFWLYYMLRMPRFHWDVIWLPFGPLSGAGVCLYVDRVLAESSSEVRKLRGYMYAYKAS